MRCAEGLPNGVQQSRSFLVQVIPERNVGRTNEVTCVKYIITMAFVTVAVAVEAMVGPVRAATAEIVRANIAAKVLR